MAFWICLLSTRQSSRHIQLQVYSSKYQFVFITVNALRAKPQAKAELGQADWQASKARARAIRVRLIHTCSI